MMPFQEQFKILSEKIAQWLGEKMQWGVNQQTLDSERVSELFERYPLLSNLPYEAYDNENQIFINKNSMGFMLEASPLTGASEETETILTSLLTDVIPKEADIQFLLWASDKIGPILDQFESARSGQGETFEWLAKQRVEFLKQGAFKSLSTSGSFILRDFKLYIVVSLPKRNCETQTQELIEVREDIQSSLKSVQIITRDIPIENFISLLWDLINPSKNCYSAQQSWNPYDALNLQMTDPEYRTQIYNNKLRFENETDQFDVRCYTVRDFPRNSWTQWRMTDAIGQLFNSALQIPCSFLISLTIRPMDYEKSTAQAQMKYMDKDSTAKSPLAKFKPNAGKEYRDWEHVRKRLSEGDRVVKIFYQVITYAPLEEGNRVERKVRDLYQANGWKLRKEVCVQFQSWLAMLPMMMSEGLYQDLKLFGRLRTVLASNAVTLAPLQGEWKGMRSPSLILPGRRGQITVWDPFDNQEGNYNVAIAAMSGSGKSVFTQEYIVSLVGSGGRVWVIDVGRSYEKTCRMLNGEYIEFTTQQAININPFTFIQNFDESLEMLKPLAATMARPSSQASDEEIAWLEKGLKAAWSEKGNQATMTTVARWLDQQPSEVCKNLAHLLYPYTQEGMYGRYFEGPCTINLDNRFVVLELEELKAKKDLQKIVLLVLMYQISERMYLGNRLQKKSCIIDEAWDLFKDSQKETGEFIETGYRRARRYRGNFVTITQSINDYFKNAMSIAAYENSAFKLILQQTAESLSQVKESKRLEMDDFTEKLFKSLRKTDEYSECVIKNASGGLSVHRIILDPYSRILYSSKGEEFEAVKQLQAQGRTLHEAVAIVARKFNHV